jgi:N-ethylmaleimide reductase
VAEAIGPERTGIRLSPGSTFGGIDEGPDGASLYQYLVPALAELDLAYLHVAHGGDEDLIAEIRRLWPNALLVTRDNRPLAKAAADVEAGLADVAAVARWALANPDFVNRYRLGVPLNEPDPTTFYGGDARGYTDYPTLDEPASTKAGL